jgi:DNA polymerase III delta subunit
LAELPEILDAARKGAGKPVYLFEGDEYLARSAARELADALVPERDRALNLVVLDASAGAREIASHLATVAMFAAPKAIVVEGAEAFAEEVDAEKELSRVRELWQGKRQRDAARRLLKLVRSAGWGAPELAFGLKTGASAAKWRKEVGVAPEDADKPWLQELSNFALVQKVTAPPADLETLLAAVERGLPPRTHLLLVAEALPPKHPLSRLADNIGEHLKRRAERRGRTIDTLDISGIVAHELKPLGKKLARDAELELKQRVGDDLRLLANELQKLAAYAGDKAQITRDDVAAIVAPVREEEFFALAEAVGEGDLGRALQLFGDELRRKANASSVALPFLGSIASSMRKALADSARYADEPPRELGYNEYQSRAFPRLEAELSEKQQKVPHPFAAWLGYKRARRKPRGFWRKMLIRCAEVDFELKNGADARLAVERLLTEVCAR